MNGEIIINYITEHCTQVAKLPKPLTVTEANKLLADADYSDILNILGEMENKRDLLKKYRSAYLTAKKFLEFSRNRKSVRENKYPQQIPGFKTRSPETSAPLQARISKEKFFEKHPIGSVYESKSGTRFIVDEDFLTSEDGQSVLPISNLLRRL